MATAAKPRVKSRERNSTEQVRTARRSACRHGLRPLRDIFSERDRAVRRGEYEILGRLMLLRTEQGDIDFQKSGPFVGRLKTKEAPLVLLDEWKGLPDIVVVQSELCDACRAKCAACDGKGERLCMHMGCGGEGKVILSYEACSADGCKRQTGQAKHDCEVCHGAGQVPGQTVECPECKGSKRQQCPLCMGSGQMATGRKDGASRETDAPACEECKGNGRKLKLEAQPWEEYALGQLEEFTALGPVHGMLWVADEMRDPRRNLEYCNIGPDKKGNLAALLIAKPQETGQPMYLLGGEPVMQFLK